MENINNSTEETLSKPFIIVIGNEKGGAGKTTCAVHLITGLLALGFNVGSIDVDSRQRSLTRYLENRALTKDKSYSGLMLPDHHLIPEATSNNYEEKKQLEIEDFNKKLESLKAKADFIIIDTPGSNNYLSSLAHSHANLIITPMNDSFVDLDLLASIDPNSYEVVKPSIYSQMIWEQKMQRAQRDKGTIGWMIMRNRLNPTKTRNNEKIGQVLEKLSNRLGFSILDGLSDRVIYKELFLNGLTLLDVRHIPKLIPFTTSHIIARAELRQFLQSIQHPGILQALASNKELSAVSINA